MQRNPPNIILTSDNGALSGDRIHEGGGMDVYALSDHKSCGDWWGYKAHIWEGSHREPFRMSWPGVIIDLIPAITGDPKRNALQGHASRDAVIHHSHRGVFAVRAGEWKLIIGSQGSGGWPPPEGFGPLIGGPGQLYNLSDDPVEEHSLFDSRPAIARDFTHLLREYSEHGGSVS